MRRLAGLAIAVAALSAAPVAPRAEEAPAPAPVPNPAPPPAPAPAPEAGPIAPVPAPTATDAEIAGKVVSEVVVDGLLTVDAEQVRRVMATRPGLPFNAGTYREDFTRIYNLGLFDSVVLERPVVTPRGLRIRVKVQERPLIDSIELRGNKKVGNRDLMDAARGVKYASEYGSKGAAAEAAANARPILKVGGRYDAYLAHQMVTGFRELYNEKRYTLATIETKTEPVADKPGHIRVVFEISEDRRVIVGRVVFQGRKAIPEDELYDAIQSKVDRWFRSSPPVEPDVLRLDAIRIQDIYRNSGYSDARVTALEPQIAEPVGWWKKRRATITFDIKEGRLYVYGPVSFTGLSAATQDEARKRANLEPGKPYSEEEVYKAARSIEALLGEKGRPLSRVMPRRQETPDPGVAGVVFHVSEGPEATVGEVRIKGNTFTQDRVIRRELEIFPGDIYDSRKVAASERNLRRRGIFEKVSIWPEAGEEPDVADIEVEVKETETGMLNFGAFVAPDDGSVGGSIGLTQRNFDWRNPPKSWEDFPGFRGGAQSVSLRAAVSDASQTYSLDFYNPWIWDTPERYGFGFSVFHTIAQYEDFDVKRTGASVRLGRAIFDPRLRAQVQYRIQNVTMHGVDDEAPDILKEEEGTTLFSSGELSLTFDGLDDPFLPTRGILLRASEEVFGGPFGGDESFFRTILEGNGYVPLFRTFGYPHVLHARVMSGWEHAYGSSDHVPASERFYAGGIGSVRGFASRTITPRIGEYAVGGEYMLVQNVEYIFPLYKDYIRGAVFYDFGNVWPDEGDFRLRDERRAVGCGLLIRTPSFLGQVPIRLYFSDAINPHRYEESQFFQLSFNFLF